MLNFDLFNPSIVASKSLSPPAVYHLYSYKLISVDGPSEEESVKGECAMYYAPLTSNKFDLGLWQKDLGHMHETSSVMADTCTKM